MAEEIILTGDDLMTTLPSPVVPPELAPRVLTPGLELCARELRALFQCLHVNEVEPFCQDHILVYRRCALNQGRRPQAPPNRRRARAGRRDRRTA